jgi:multidrug efflux pump subunit AcrB
MKKSLKRSLLVIAGVLVATLAVFAQSATVEKLYKNEQEKKELVTAIMQDQELSGEITEKLMADMECCKEMMAGNEHMMKMCSKMMASMENHSSMCNMMMGKDEKPQPDNKADEIKRQLDKADKN